ncbi:membrane protein YdbS with pleckstrin-like domain [Okibacterium sp. HSC-33S16]|uniref:PH domain-containing protein n=1 Tax=Okibacterium sp. HSC-33S16 TaxID=2910965 RepID=UPI0020A228B6|nr:PH domain-containing protein [Okibacterium sp. HSC-33S16]MCP2031656.1 membrane protein YdbS with pleckstrin-like domain [Okibacterium sp. HSC-33S16]
MVDSPNAPGGMPPEIGSRPSVPTERVVARLRSHARILFWPALIFIALPGVSFYSFSVFTERWQHTLIGILATLAFLFLVLLPYILWLNRRSTLTTRRIIVRRGFFVRERREVFHSRGYHIALKRTWLQSAFRSGDIVISSGVEKPLVLRDVPGANAVLETLHDLVEKNQVVLSPHAGSVGTATTAF